LLGDLRPSRASNIQPQSSDSRKKAQEAQSPGGAFLRTLRLFAAIQNQRSYAYGFSGGKIVKGFAAGKDRRFCWALLEGN
jgi:hypothetical protein